jgi:Putative DNA-binding domain
VRSLLKLQDEMVSAIMSGDISHIVAELDSGAADPSLRFNIFRNNSYATLAACLKSVFPVSVKLSDERFFAYAAHEFIKSHPPREARLNVYGAEFPGFLAGFAPCHDFPILVDMAMLEWAISEAAISAEAPPLSVAEFSKVDQDGGRVGLKLQPSLRFVVTRWPLLGVWADHKKDVFVINGPLEKKPSRVALCRSGDGVKFFELEPARFSFWRSLARGRSLEISTRNALMRDPLFDLLQEIVFLLRQNLIANISNNTAEEIDDEQ